MLADQSLTSDKRSQNVDLSLIDDTKVPSASILTTKKQHTKLSKKIESQLKWVRVEQKLDRWSMSQYSCSCHVWQSRTIE